MCRDGFDAHAHGLVFPVLMTCDDEITSPSFSLLAV